MFRQILSIRIFLIIFFTNTYTLYVPLGSDKAQDYARISFVVFTTICGV